MTTAPQILDLQPIVGDRAVQENFRRIAEWVRTQLPRPTAVGQLAYWNGNQWVLLAIGQPGETLQVGPAGTPVWGP